MKVQKFLLRFGLTALVAALCSCTSAAKIVNPYYEEPSEVALLGQANDHALNGTLQKEDTARKALEHMASYQRTQLPSPNKPVVQPAVIRLMWIPDHLNSHNDLVPAHYYYLKVLKDRWAVTDAFELEKQLGPNVDAGNLPYVYEGDTDEFFNR